MSNLERAGLLSIPIALLGCVYFWVTYSYWRSEISFKPIVLLLILLFALGVALGLGVGWVLWLVFIELYPDLYRFLDLNAGQFFFAGPVVVIAGTFAQWHWLRRRFVRAYGLPGDRCASCGYLLIGLRVVRKSLRCPECGAIEKVRSIRRRTEDRGVVLGWLKVWPWRETPKSDEQDRGE